MREITLTAKKTHPESDFWVASWNDPDGGGITTQADSQDQLFREIENAVRCYFDKAELPDTISVHFEKDFSLSLLEPVTGREVMIALACPIKRGAENSRQTPTGG